MTEATHDHPAQQDHDEHEHGPHVVPLWMLLGVFASLIFLTAVTVAVVYIDLGWFNIWLAMGIATVKAILVCLIFMHLAWDRPFNTIVFVGSLIFVFLFVSMSMLDSSENLSKKQLRNDKFPEYFQSK
jgi:cytochrome c oxidase subunit 4